MTLCVAVSHNPDYIKIWFILDTAGGVLRGRDNGDIGEMVTCELALVGFVGIVN